MTSLSKAVVGAFVGFDPANAATGIPGLQVGRRWYFDRKRPEEAGYQVDNNDGVFTVSAAECEDKGQALSKVFMGVAADLDHLKATEQGRQFMQQASILTYRIGVDNPRCRVVAQLYPTFFEFPFLGLREFAEDSGMSGEDLATHESTMAFMGYVEMHAAKCTPWFKRAMPANTPLIPDGVFARACNVRGVPRAGTPLYTQQQEMF